MKKMIMMLMLISSTAYAGTTDNTSESETQDQKVVKLIEERDISALENKWDDLVANAENIPQPESRLSSNRTMCVAQAIYHEARGESLEGRLAVASVIYTRAWAKRWKNTPCDVIAMKHAFSFVKSGRSLPPFAEKDAWRDAWVLSSYVQDTLPWMDKVDHYHTTSVSPSWAKKMKLVRRIGVHKFYSDPATYHP